MQCILCIHHTRTFANLDETHFTQLSVARKLVNISIRANVWLSEFMVSKCSICRTELAQLSASLLVYHGVWVWFSLRCTISFWQPQLLRTVLVHVKWCLWNNFIAKLELPKLITTIRQRNPTKSIHFRFLADLVKRLFSQKFATPYLILFFNFQINRTVLVD